MIFQFSVSVVIDREQVAVIDIFQLPLGKPDVMPVGYRSVLHLTAKKNHAIEHVESIARPASSAREIDRAFGKNGCGFDPQQLFVKFLVVIAGRLALPLNPEQFCRCKRDRVLYPELGGYRPSVLKSRNMYPGPL